MKKILLTCTLIFATSAFASVASPTTNFSKLDIPFEYFCMIDYGCGVAEIVTITPMTADEIFDIAILLNSNRCFSQE